MPDPDYMGALLHALPGSMVVPWLQHQAQGALNTARIPGDTAVAGYGGYQQSPQEMIPAALKMSQAAMTSGPPMAQQGAAGIFGGRLGTRTDPKMYRNMTGAANELEAGADPAAVYSQRGIHQGPDNQLRFEINDQGSRLKTENMGQMPGGKWDPYPNDAAQPTVGMVLDHPELYKRYPDLKEMPVYNETNSRNLGSYNPGFPSISLGNLTGERARSTLLHELQHAVQHKEGFTPGSAPESMMPDPGGHAHLEGVIQKSDDALKDIWKKEIAQPLQEHLGTSAGKLTTSRDWYDNALARDKRGYELTGPHDEKAVAWIKENHPYYAHLRNEQDEARKALHGYIEQNRPQAYQDYKNTYGEVEARMVQEREKMSPEERRAVPPQQSKTFTEAYPSGQVDLKYILSAMKKPQSK